jgi:hypothetical protein
MGQGQRQWTRGGQGKEPDRMWVFLEKPTGEFGHSWPKKSESWTDSSQ